MVGMTFVADGEAAVTRVAVAVANETGAEVETLTLVA